MLRSSSTTARAYCVVNCRPAFEQLAECCCIVLVRMERKCRLKLEEVIVVRSTSGAGR